MPKGLSDVAADIVELMGKKRSTVNILAKKLPEIKDVPNNLKLTLFGRGTLLGEEDLLTRETYTCKVTCSSLNGTLYYVNKRDFLALRS